MIEMFCPKCGSLMTPTTKKGKRVLVCKNCNFERPVEGEEWVSEVELGRKQRVVVIDEKEKFEIYPKTKIECPKCGYNEAYYWMMQTRGGDEPETRFYKCVKCGYTWREYT